MSARQFSLVPHRSVIAVGGPDRVEFLQGLISNDATKVAPGRTISAALLTPQRRFLNAMFVAHGGHGAFRQTPGGPAGRADLVVGRALLRENGFDELNGMDWQRGCYMGQGLTARTKSRPLTRKRLFPVRIEGVLPEPGAAIFKDGQEV